ncbi:MAG: hypothetical protein ABI550_06535, partial [Ignavibacteriaceae bacterium]
MIKILIWVTLIIAGIFGILSAEYTTLGWVAFGCGLFSGLLSNLQNQVENKTIRDLLDAQNTINFKTGGSNLYLQTFFNELSKKKISKYDDKLLKKAIETSPKDNNALLTWLSIEILRIEQKKFF